MKGKKIIFAAPLHFRLNEVIKGELEAVGFTVIDISFLENKFKYNNIFERLKSYFIKNFGKDKYYKTTLQFNRKKEQINALLDQMRRADYAFIIRPDVFPLETLIKIKSKAEKFIGYQWDGLQRFPKVYHTIPYFDIFYVFDKKDLEVDSTRITTNFYPEAISLDNTLQPSDVYYAGSYNKYRIKDLEQLIDYAQELNLKVDYTLFSRKKSHRNKSKLTITSIANDYFTNLRHVAATQLLLDIVNPTHEGLSFRTFEAIGFRKKLITTNKSIAQYDFYNPNNILIWDSSKNIHDFKQFIDLPYIELEEEIRLKYGFRHWIQQILEPSS